MEGQEQTVYLVGTAHVSSSSANDAKAVIRAVRPQVVYAWTLGQLGAKLETPPGEEFRAAVQEAANVDAKVVLGDRLVSVTLARAWASLTQWQRMRLLWDLMRLGGSSSSQDQLTDKLESYRGDADLLTTAIQKFGVDYPSLVGPFLSERDQYMVCTLRMLASRATRIVAVVGAGHLPGIKEAWEVEIDVENLTQLPPPSLMSRIPWGKAVASLQQL
eukprot:jgi/Astpho2/7507/Aster-x1441